MDPLLSIVCVTRYEDHAVKFLRGLLAIADVLPNCQLVIGADGDQAHDVLGYSDWAKQVFEGHDLDLTVVPVNSKGYLESVLDEVLEATRGRYILRLDDDEACSPAMIRWLHDQRYREHDNWKFSRAHLWPDENHFIIDAPLWPDHQTRLSVRSKSGGRTTIHAGSPYGGGQLAPVVIEHHKFLVRTEADRRTIAERYDRVMRGAGTSPNMAPFQLPDLSEANVHPYGYGIDVGALIDEAEQVGMFQQRGELEQLIRWLSQSRRLHNVVEIGTLHGGTAALWHNLSSGCVVTVDLPDGRFGGKDHGYNEEKSLDRMIKLQTNYPRIRNILGNSHDIETFYAVKNELEGQEADLLFIDGDHTYKGVKRDWELYKTLLKPGGIIAFHDILDTPMHRAHGCEVHKLWHQLPGHKAAFSVNGPWGGIGITFA